LPIRSLLAIKEHREHRYDAENDVPLRQPA